MSKLPRVEITAQEDPLAAPGAKRSKAARGRQRDGAPAPIWLGTGEAPVPRLLAQLEAQPGLPERGLPEEVVRLEFEALSRAKGGHLGSAADALGCALEVRRTTVEAGSAEEATVFSQAVLRYIGLCNKWSAISMEKGQAELALELLKRADMALEVLPVQNSKDKAELRAYNLLGICELYKTRGKMRAALQACERAAKACGRFGSSRRLALEVDGATLLILDGCLREATTRLEALHSTPMLEDPLVAVVQCHLWLVMQRLGRTRTAEDMLLKASEAIDTHIPASATLSRRLSEFLAAAKPARWSVQVGRPVDKWSKEASKATSFLPDLPGKLRQLSALNPSSQAVEERITWRTTCVPSAARPLQTVLPAYEPSRPPQLPSFRENVYGRAARAPGRSFLSALLEGKSAAPTGAAATPATPASPTADADAAVGANEGGSCEAGEE